MIKINIVKTNIMKINIYYNNLLLLFTIVLLYSCNEKQSETYVFYLDESITTPISVNKSSFFSYGSVFKCPTNLEQAKRLEEELSRTAIQTDFKNLDIRYIIGQSRDTIGLDRFGNTIHYSNNNIVKKCKNINSIVKNIILENKDEIKVIKKGTNLPKIPDKGFK